MFISMNIKHRLNMFRIKFSIIYFNRNYFMTCCFNSTCFVN